MIGLWFHTLNALYGVEYFESLLILPGAKAILEIIEKIRHAVWGNQKAEKAGAEKLDETKMHLLELETLIFLFKIAQVCLYEFLITSKELQD